MGLFRGKKKVVIEISIDHVSRDHKYAHVDLIIRDAVTNRPVKNHKLKLHGIPPKDDRIRVAAEKAIKKFVNEARKHYEVLGIRDPFGLLNWF